MNKEQKECISRCKCKVTGSRNQWRKKYATQTEKYIKKYVEDGVLFYYSDEDSSYMYHGSRTVFLRKEVFTKSDENTLFELLHELGHIENNDVDTMTDYELEYYATKWAIEEFHKLKFKINGIEQMEWEEYIDSFPHKKNLKLKW